MARFREVWASKRPLWKYLSGRLGTQIPAFSCLKHNALPIVRTVKSLTFGPGTKVHAGPGKKSMGSLGQRQLVGHILHHLHSRSLYWGFGCVPQSKRKPKVPQLPTIGPLTLIEPTQGSQYHCLISPGCPCWQQNEASQGACRQAVEPQLGSQSGRHMVWRSCAQVVDV